MMRNILAFALLFFCSGSFAQKANCNKNCFVKSVSKGYKIIFNRYDAAFNLYANPVILANGKANKIKGYDHNNYTGASMKISPDKRFLVMDYIIKGYVSGKNDSTLYENYNCIIIDIKKYKIIQEMQSDCGGKWNKHNQWVNAGNVIFDSNASYNKKK